MSLTKVSGDVIQGTINVGVVTSTSVTVGTGVTIQSGGATFTGVVTATSFSGNATSATLATNAQGLTGTPNITVGSITAASATFSGNISVAGTVTYEDVTNVDSVGVVTARSGLVVNSGGLQVTSGVSTFTSGPVLIGSGTSTGTASQTLQVTGGAYISGNLGLGTTNPNYKMLIYGTNNSNEIRQSDGTVVSQWYQDSSGIGYFGTVSNHPQVFRTGSIDRVRVDTSGRLGVGTAYSPSARVDVSLDGFVANTLSQVRSNSWGANGIINLYNANGSSGSATGNEILLIGSQSGGLGAIASGIGFGRENSGNWGTYLSFKTHSTSTSTIDELYERVRIDSSGNLGVGTANPTSKLHVVDGNITAGDVTLGQTHIDIMKMWRTADIQGYKSDYGDGGSVSYTWDNGTVRVDTSVGSHNWDVGKVRLPAGVYQIYLQYRPSPTQHGWNVYGTNSNAHRIRLQSDAGYGSYTEFLVVTAQLNKDVGYSRLFTSGTYQVTTETTYRIGMQTDPYTTGGYKCFIESAYLIKLR